ncbi:hypothetical protein GGS23DRAFT_350723 [Durotheca rogersii]|uniref:uncharacterized protein n=1 Tax=Durotheca rogersii TaxID=419775 RepID=UPI0022205311|nr:uncharacterized protein GGS23DRAFT_350723 [Durotheca rogersii]KAI5865689.1 hypothetical protein GGS23DRAFT_350723 [Durotheca rogersii]
MAAVSGTGAESGSRVVIGIDDRDTDLEAEPIAYEPAGPTRYPKSILELVYHTVAGDPDAKWGPFQPYIRASKKRGTWREWTIRQIAKAAPRDVADRDEESEDDDDSDYGDGEAQGEGRAERRTRGSFSFNLDDFALDNRPAHIDFAALLQQESHPADYDDDFFKKHYGNLYTRTVKFVKKWFDSKVDLTRIAGDDIWASPLTDQFIQYARLVAHEDQTRGGWPIILNHPTQRRWLIVGILAQVMEKKIFNELLFGADQATREELERLDDRWLQKEGYHRKAVRAITARYGVEAGLLPGNFWPAVDELTAKTMKIFLPLLNVFKEIWPRRELYTPELFLQELHNIISYAGMIQVCMAVSPSIFHILSASPGARMDYAIEKQSDMELYRESKDFYEVLDQEWRAKVEIAMRARDAGGNAPPGQIDVPSNDEERSVMEYHRIRGARVKFAVFPKITRYKPENKGKGTLGLHLYGRYPEDNDETELEGQTIIDISDCLVVYFQGLIYPPPGLAEGESLDAHIHRFSTQTNGLIDLLARAASTCYLALRTLTTHFLVITLTLAAPILAILLVYWARDIAYYLLRCWVIAILWISFGIYCRAASLAERNDRRSGIVLLSLPLFILIILIFTGLYYILTRPNVLNASIRVILQAAERARGDFIRYIRATPQANSL